MFLCFCHLLCVLVFHVVSVVFHVAILFVFVFSCVVVVVVVCLYACLLVSHLYCVFVCVVSGMLFCAMCVYFRLCSCLFFVNTLCEFIIAHGWCSDQKTSSYQENGQLTGKTQRSETTTTHSGLSIF